MNIGPHKSIRPRVWSSRSGPSWISARSCPSYSWGLQGPVRFSGYSCAGRPYSILLISVSRTSAGSFPGSDSC
jgi:hypothetical protein